MGRLVEELCKEELVDMVKRMLADKLLTVEKIAEYSGFTVEEVKELEKQQ